MAESYSVEAVLSVIDQGFTQAMEKAQLSTKGLGASAKTSSMGVGNMAKAFAIAQVGLKAVGAVFNAVSGTIGTLTSEMNDNQKAWKTFEANMTMVGKSETEIAKVKSSLQDFATQTIYSASDMASTYSQMAAIGVENTEALVKGMGGLAASAENPAQAMKSMSQQMVQAMAQPELKWQDFRIMMDQAPAAMAQVAQQMGYGLDEFIVAIQDGEIASKDFAAAIVEVGNNEHFSKMATEFKTVDQAVDGLTETVANKLMPAFELLSSIAIKAIEGLANWIGDLNFDGVLAPIQALAEMFGVTSDGATELTDTLTMTTEEITALSNEWEGMTLSEKQAKLNTMGKADIEELMKLLGVDFESLPDEYHKDAYLNAHGADAFEEVLFLTGEWHNLTFEEKRAVLETQIENKALLEAIESRDLWNEEEFYSHLADIDMSDTDAEQQVLDLINTWAELKGLEPAEVEVRAKTKEAEKGLGKFQKTFNQFSKGFGKIVSHLQTLGEKMFEFAEPAFDFLGDLFTIGLDSFSGYLKSFEKLIDGDWKGAWDTFKETSTNAVKGVIDSLKTNVPKLWDNVKGATSGLWQAFRGIDWGVVLTEINSFFGGIADQITSIDWYAVGVAVSGTVADLGIAISDYINDTFGDGKMGDLIMKAIKEMFDPRSDLNVDAGKFTNAVMKTLDGIADGISQAIGGFNITESAAVWRGKLNQFFSGLKNTWENIVDTDWAKSFEMGTVLEDIKTAFTEGFANFEFGEFKFEWPEVDWGSWAPLVEQFKTEVESVKAAIIEIFSSISLSDILPKIEFKVPFGDLFKLDWETGEWNKVEVEIDVEAKPNVEVVEDESWLDKIKNFFSGLGPVKVDAAVEARPVISMAGGTGGGALTGAVGGGLGGSFADGLVGQITAQVQTAMSGANTAASSGMASINATVRAGANMVRATFTQLGTSLTQTMSQVMSSLVSATTSGMSRVVSATRSGMSSVVTALNSAAGAANSAGRNLGMGFHAGLSSTMGSIIALASDIASSAANAIKRGLQIKSPSRVGFYLFEMLGQGLFNGLESMFKPLQNLYGQIIDMVTLSPQSMQYDLNPNVIKPDIAAWNLASQPLPGMTNTNQIYMDTSRLEAKLDQLLAKDANTYIDRDLWVGGTSDAYDRRFGQDYNELSGRLLL